MFGVILGCIGIMGQYIGRIFDESKGRPIYIIDSTKNYTRSDKKLKIVNLEQKTL
jgi:polyisoprenyl-phosphate glycosyltransferase